MNLTATASRSHKKMLDLKALVAIGFPTRNRWTDVQETLHRLAGFGLGGLRILIYDDGSDEPCPFDVASICPGAELRRFSESAGMIVRRNQIARDMDSKYYLGLDDDSFPVTGSLEKAVEFAESCADVFSLSFPIYNPRLGAFQVESIHSEPYQVRSFIGCGHLVHRGRLLELGGFCEEFGFFLEESEVSARAFLRGYQCYHDPRLLIHHMASNTWRNWQRMDYYGARNNVLWNDWYVPGSRKLERQMKLLAARMIVAAKGRRTASLRGYFAGMSEARRLREHQQPMTGEQFRAWRRLPSS